MDADVEPRQEALIFSSERTVTDMGYLRNMSNLSSNRQKASLQTKLNSYCADHVDRSEGKRRFRCYIGTWNARTLSSDVSVDMLIEERNRLRTDILAVDETRSETSPAT
ncbi:unnamed protein product [Toxocara canis]|uniref:Uncharacterized protein n=1 Tax=Toxocara canis TaxID=6265 RepID=A0A183UQI9_TOXCA|nr:unnamed protein product [Toxocara canis]